jgi:hypothetical protein
MMILALLLQVEAAPAPPPAQPDIQLDIRATARRVLVETRGRADLNLRTSVNGREGENNMVEVDAPELPPGRRELSNVDVRVRAEARIEDPLSAPQSPEPASPQ